MGGEQGYVQQVHCVVMKDVAICQCCDEPLAKLQSLQASPYSGPGGKDVFIPLGSHLGCFISLHCTLLQSRSGKAPNMQQQTAP